MYAPILCHGGVTRIASADADNPTRFPAPSNVQGDLSLTLGSELTTNDDGNWHQLASLPASAATAEKLPQV
jgi:hypothetical protein